ncbi:hypothetical protein [Pararcticibacter amylolyticus]|uniref:Uncharacterized protein n=1 Tax=Pararcticibacter amylolyticus TaxID=2173175 RepID=A0A2U2PGR1_9SPHI|nr:hypothetical protein [Pararcticibacter amylolyticus]PWG80432.1 hypothetical protein DDR33_12585 [Pararcticibacter amylolyticus]
MKQTFILIVAVFLTTLSFGQEIKSIDQLVKHNGEKLEVKVIRVGETTVIFKYPGEEAEQTVSKFAVSYINYSSGRKEEISEKIEISGKDDWEKVEVLTDKSQIVGLKKGEAVKGKTSGLLSYNTAGSADKKASRRIREAAAEMKAPFVLLLSDKSDGFGIKQAIKTGVAYYY